MPLRRCALKLVLLVLVSLPQASCKSPLQEFLCVDDQECQSENPDGVCRTYCAFPDELCSSDLRYGEASGDDSNACVKAEAEQDDAGVPDANAPFNEDPDVTLTDGWNLEIAFDLSDDYTYEPNQFLDGTTWNDNPPHELIALKAPFVSGFGFVAGTSVYELDYDTEEVIKHDLAPVESNTVGPDGPTTLSFHANGSSLLLGSGSPNGGDGLYQIDSNWQISRIINQNNVHLVTTTLFPRVGYAAGTSFYGWLDNTPAKAGLSALGGGDPVALLNVLSGALLSDGRFLLVELTGEVADATTRLLTLGEQWNRTNITEFSSGDQHIVSGDVASFGALAMVVRDEGILSAWDSNGTWTNIAQQKSLNWVWVAATFVEAAQVDLNHDSVFILRYSNDYSKLEILRLWRP